jgi:uncharacterized protein YjeT (DUF2065 family)
VAAGTLDCMSSRRFRDEESASKIQAMFVLGWSLVLLAVGIEFALWSSAFSRFMYLEELQYQLAPEAFRLVVGVNPTEKTLAVFGAGVLIAGVILLVAGLRQKKNHQAKPIA